MSAEVKRYILRFVLSEADDLSKQANCAWEINNDADTEELKGYLEESMPLLFREIARGK